ncbi:hypothetical protein NLX67_15350 [Domibacillus sp. A3M-37]|uniref:hypothetical protein n=1 Tax=Domibacillus sp. A3M-37 TaxID=2962037 RepID=UPI0020B6C55F|nr:hypothetical protein [Domibacillus sp. A3M-37]MCP3763750.1 hypothetical protein [Domibacillus sp. A3M-37]
MTGEHQFFRVGSMPTLKKGWSKAKRATRLIHLQVFSPLPFRLSPILSRSVSKNVSDKPLNVIRFPRMFFTCVLRSVNKRECPCTAWPFGCAFQNEKARNKKKRLLF